MTTPKLRVLIISQYFPPDFGGHVTRVANLTKALRDMDWSVDVIAAEPHYLRGEARGVAREELRLDSNFTSVRRIRLLPLPTEGVLRRGVLFLNFVLLSALALVRSLSLRNRVDVVYACTPPVLVAIPGLVARRLLNAPLVLDAPDLYPEELVDTGMLSASSMITAMLFAVARILYRNADGVTTVSSGIRSWLIRCYDLPLERVFVVPSGVDTSLFRPLTAPAETVHASSDVNVLYAGNFSLFQQFDTILKAAEILQDNSVTFTFIGDGERRDELLDQVRKRRLTNVIINPRLPWREMAKAISEADVCISLLKKAVLFRDAMPTKVFEFMACGKPIITSIGGDMQRLIIRTGGGFKIDSDDPEGLSKAILSIKQDKERWRRLGLENRRLVEEEYSIEAVGRRITHAFAGLGVMAKANQG